MKKLKNLIGKTKFHVYLGNPAQNSPIEITIEGRTFYRTELDKKYRIGDIYDFVKLMSKFDSRLAVKKGNKFRDYQYTIDKTAAQQLLREGYAPISVESLCTLQYDEGYNHIMISSSSGEIYEIDSIPPGPYTVNIFERRLPKTYDEVQAIKAKEAADEAKRIKDDEKKQRQMEIEIEQKIRRRLFEEERKAKNEQKNSTAISKPEPVENDESLLDSLLKIAGGIGIFLTGIGLGVFLDKKLN